MLASSPVVAAATIPALAGRGVISLALLRCMRSTAVLVSMAAVLSELSISIILYLLALVVR